MLEYIVARILILSFIILASLIDISYLKFISKLEWQVIFGTIVVLVILFADAYTGLLLGVLFLVTYLRFYMKEFNLSFIEKKFNKYPMNSLVTSEYITEKHLKDAQNNIVDERNYTNTYVGVRGVYGEDVYSSQGIDKVMPGIVEKLPNYAPF